jgi:hypothetical protein
MKLFGLALTLIFVASPRCFAGTDALESSQIPGMEFLLRQVAALKVSPGLKSKLTQFITPAAGRTYFAADQSRVPAEESQRLRQLYAALMKIPVDQVVLLAVTKASTGETFLLPEFFRLKTAPEQAALLLHESLWLETPQKSYEEVVAVEQAAQDFFENPAEPKAYYDFYQKLSFFFDEPASLLQATLDFDRRGKYPWMPGEEKQSRSGVLLNPFLGEKYLRCYFKPAPGRVHPPESCNDELLMDLAIRSAQHPGSLFLRGFIEYLHLGKVLNFKIENILLPGCTEEFIPATYCRRPNFPNLDEKIFGPFIQQLFLKVDASGEQDHFALTLQSEDRVGQLEIKSPALSPNVRSASAFSISSF